KSGSSATVNLTSEQRTRIQQTVLSGSNVPRVDRVDFAVTVGTTVPSHVHVVEVSPTLIEIHPEWRDDMYFVAEDEIVIVDRSHKVVAVVPVGSSPRAGARGSSSSFAAADLSEAEIREIQQVLTQRGFYHGRADGRFSPQFRQALITFQRRQGIRTIGEIDVRTVTALGLSDKVHVRESSSTTTTTTTGQGNANQPGNAMNNNRDGQAGKQPQQSKEGQAGKQPRQPQDGPANQPPHTNNSS